MNDIQINGFDPTKMEEILEFSKKYPFKPTWPAYQIHKFLRELISDSKLAFDVSKNNRVAFFVLIDKVNNKGNNAVFEIIGLDHNNITNDEIKNIIKKSQEVLPATKNGIEISVHQSYNFLYQIALDLGFKFYYDSYDMELTSFDNIKSDFSKLIETSTEQDDTEIYSVLNNSFVDNYDICIPDFESWKYHRRQSSDSTTYLSKSNGKIIGFLTVYHTKDETPQINTIGVLPNKRNKGIGKQLIQKCLIDLKNKGFTNCKLTVSVQNQNALNLYHDMGFQETNHYTSLCWKSPKD